jgi:hypothetical protein
MNPTTLVCLAIVVAILAVVAMVIRNRRARTGENTQQR